MGTRKGYDLELKEINDRVETMGKQVLLAIDRTIIALEKMDVVAANAIMKNDALIDAMETDIEERCIQIVVKEQPIASDWRRLASYMRMISDLERIADNCSDIAIYIKKLASLKTVTPPAHLGEAFSSMRQMVADMVEAFHNEDLQLAEKVVKADDVIDDLFEKNVQEIRDAIKADTDAIEQYLDYLFIDKYVERMADHVTAVASWISFITKGELNIMFTDRYARESKDDPQ
ncbi:phosphate signaling complex protein PhoU [Porcincola intestinalis]|uniref:Phosphate-specific transport system accessory protein PhoU n=1 Tax=Porcincola intestinalis TaxID=2606632 RepID=A0A6L5X4P8_9FIRM|nr:phosphate signaling complex protein PhoU [Porcincola intestinalis]MSS15341.1 phosphate signaling complex protein PhoU [Porcincola intestinalis]